MYKVLLLLFQLFSTLYSIKTLADVGEQCYHWRYSICLAHARAQWLTDSTTMACFTLPADKRNRHASPTLPPTQVHTQWRAYTVCLTDSRLSSLLTSWRQIILSSLFESPLKCVLRLWFQITTTFITLLLSNLFCEWVFLFS